MNNQISLNKSIFSNQIIGKGNIVLPILSVVAIAIVALLLGQAPALTYIYFIAGSILLGWLLNKYNNRPKVCFTLMLFLVAYLTVFIGLRDFGIGTDTTVYIDTYWETGQYVDGVKDFFGYDYISKAYLLLSVIGHLFSNDHQTMLVLTALTINLSTFLALYVVNYKKLEVNWVLYIFLWQFLFMNTTMNEMRQDCAQGFALLSIVLFIKKKWLWFAVCAFISFEFHSTVLALLPMFGCFFLDRYFGPKQRNIYTIVGLIALVVIVTSIFQFGNWLISSGWLSDHFDLYTNTSTFESTNLFGVSYMAISVLFVYVCLYLRKKKLISSSLNYYLLTIYGISFIFRLAAFSLVYLSRLSHYYTYIAYFALAYLMTQYSKKIPLTVQVMIYIVVLYTWFSATILGDSGETYPYKSEILGI